MRSCNLVNQVLVPVAFFLLLFPKRVTYFYHKKKTKLPKLILSVRLCLGDSIWKTKGISTRGMGESDESITLQ